MVCAVRHDSLDISVREREPSSSILVVSYMEPVWGRGSALDMFVEGFS